MVRGPWLQALCVGIVLLVATAAAPAFAQWRMVETTYKGDPAYSLMADLDADHYLRLSCYGDVRENVLTDRDGQGVSVYPGTVDYVWLEVKSDAGKTWNSPGDFFPLADGSLGLYYRASDDMRAIVEDIVAAQAEISVTMIHVVMGTSDTFLAGAKGSTKAGRDFLQKCFGPAAPQPTLSLSAWDIGNGPDPVTGMSTMVLVGEFADGVSLHASCGPDHRASLAVLGPSAAHLPFEAGDVGLMVHLEVDGRDLSAVGEFFTAADGRDGIRYASDYLDSVLASVGAATSSLDVRVQSYASGVEARWPARNLQGLAQSASQFSHDCAGDTPVVADAPATAAPAGEWVFSSYEQLHGTSYALYATTDDGKATLTFRCEPDGTRAIALQTGEAQLFPVTGRSTDILLRVGAGDRDFRLPADFDDTAAGLTQVRSGSAIDLKEIVVRIANGEGPRGAAVTNLTSGDEYISSIGGVGAQEAALQFAQSCLDANEKLALKDGQRRQLPGWHAIDGEAADLRNYSSIIIYASTEPAAGRLEINCYAETGARGIAYYSDDFTWGETVSKATQMDMAVFIGDDYWPIVDPRLSASAADIGIGGTDQAQVSEILRALADGPAEVTVSVRVNFGDWEPRTISPGDAAAVTDFLARCPG